MENRTDGAAGKVKARTNSLKLVVSAEASSVRQLIAPEPSTCALQQVGSYLRYTGRGANAFGEAARDPKQTCFPLPVDLFQLR
jgi:hypothetical protein